MMRWWRLAAVVVALGALSWIGVQIVRAGSDQNVPRPGANSTLKNGRIDGRRVDGRAWSLDYDTLTLTPDGVQGTIAHVRDGRLHRAGKPDITLKGDGVTLNMVTNDLSIAGPLTLVEPMHAGVARTFSTVGAIYNGTTRTLTLEHPATVSDAGTTVTVANAKIDFRHERATFGRIVARGTGFSAP